MEVNWKEYDNIIIELINEGLSYEKIGNKLDIYREKIRKRCIFLNIKSKYYEKKKKYCLECNKEIEGDKRKIFCGSSCSSIHNHKKRGFIKKDNECLICKNKIGQKSRFCSNTCYSESNYIEYIKKWKKGEETGISGEDGIRTHIRRYLFKKYNSKCCECGWNEINKKTGKIPLQVEHIDGNYKNNKEENLKLLCPNCHSLTETYGSLNKGNGREGRKKWRYKIEQVVGFEPTL